MAAALGVLSIGAGIYGSISSAKAAKKAAKKSRQLGRLNEQGLLNLAISDHKIGLRQIRDFQWEAARFQGRQLAHITGSGLNADFGSAAAVRAEDAFQIVRDVSTIRRNIQTQTEQTLDAARIARLGGESQAAQFRAQGTAAIFSGVGSALSSSASLLEGVSAGFGQRQRQPGDNPY